MITPLGIALTTLDLVGVLVFMHAASWKPDPPPPHPYRRIGPQQRWPSSMERRKAKRA